MTGYPRLEIRRSKLAENYRRVLARCHRAGICVAGVIKGFNAIEECVLVADEAGCEFLASSRIDHLAQAAALQVKTPLMMIRTPMLSEVPDVVRLAGYSLESETAVLLALEEEAARQDKIHHVILMSDLGDLREGWWDDDELLQAALHVEKELPHLELSGIGTNLGCYGSIIPTREKLQELVVEAEMIEAAIGRRLDYISGGATTSFFRVLEDNMPPRINMLRIGEGIINGTSGYDAFDFLERDVFTATAEVIEVKEKPSYPVGEIGGDAFGHKQEYHDIGIRRRAIVAMGKGDYAYPEDVFPCDGRITVIGASSDHTLLDVTEAPEITVGDHLSFLLGYGTLLHASQNMPHIFRD
ncbi:MAG: alanine racemase [Anaerovoracaceae bacterium]|jgi:predicted amino acid racemase